jgi:hypothetical protein
MKRRVLSIAQLKLERKVSSEKQDPTEPLSPDISQAVSGLDLLERHKSRRNEGQRPHSIVIPTILTPDSALILSGGATFGESLVTPLTIPTPSTNVSELPPRFIPDPLLSRSTSRVIPLRTSPLSLKKRSALAVGEPFGSLVGSYEVILFFYELMD